MVINTAPKRTELNPTFIAQIKKTIKYVNTASSGAGAVNPVWRG